MTVSVAGRDMINNACQHDQTQCCPSHTPALTAAAQRCVQSWQRHDRQRMSARPDAVLTPTTPLHQLLQHVTVSVAGRDMINNACQQMPDTVLSTPHPYTCCCCSNTGRYLAEEGFATHDGATRKSALSSPGPPPLLLPLRNHWPVPGRGRLRHTSKPGTVLCQAPTPAQCRLYPDVAAAEKHWPVPGRGRLRHS